MKNSWIKYESSNKIFSWKLLDSYEHLDRIYKYFSNPLIP